MSEKNKNDSYCSEDDAICSCRVESIVSVDERGQMVLPKEIRAKAGIQPGDKLAVMSWEKSGKVCCISMLKVNDLAVMVRQTLGPVMQEIFGADTQ